METTETKPEVQLLGQDSNAFVILGLCRRAAKKANWTPERISEFMTKATSGDYNSLLAIVQEHFDVY